MHLLDECENLKILTLGQDLTESFEAGPSQLVLLNSGFWGVKHWFFFQKTQLDWFWGFKGLELIG